MQWCQCFLRIIHFNGLNFKSSKFSDKFFSDSKLSNVVSRATVKWICSLYFRRRESQALRSFEKQSTSDRINSIVRLVAFQSRYSPILPSAETPNSPMLLHPRMAKTSAPTVSSRCRRRSRSSSCFEWQVFVHAAIVDWSIFDIVLLLHHFKVALLLPSRWHVWVVLEGVGTSFASGGEGGFRGRGWVMAKGGQVGMWVGSLAGTESELPRELSWVCEGVVRSKRACLLWWRGQAPTVLQELIIRAASDTVAISWKKYGKTKDKGKN